MGLLHFREWGERNDLPSLVLLHGFLEDSRMWDHLVPLLRSGRHLIALDLPAHGQTPQFEEVHTMDFMAQCVRETLDHLGLEKVAMLGHSMGGYVVLAFAEAFPTRLDQFALFFSSPEEDDEIKKSNRLRATKLVKTHRELYIQNAIPLLFDPHTLETHKTQIARQVEMSLEMPSEGIIAAIKGMTVRPDRTALLVNAPEEGQYRPKSIGIIAGRADTVVPFERSQYFASLPQVGHSFFSNHGHMGHITSPEACARAIDQWLEL